ncbi:exodeoxyribonuclease VII small subunit [Tepidicaulis marinus]|uniref:Exodeoxyribonuclease 7 small subunit n=2 Tax=Tepidicaulis TaxID=1742977 RepID=A0A081BDK3_9HYPH|nr:exodeoxyribonuclease VII small subunit [Tepidicaulis marinus]GAK46121.1 exodeoxyribonuclease VII small subunit [Tepidicaulis marinus]
MAEKKTAIPDDIAKMNFETALKELEGIVGKLESGNAPLEESIELYERGNLLKAHCESRLKAAQAKVEKITLGADGAAGTEPANID